MDFHAIEIKIQKNRKFNIVKLIHHINKSKRLPYTKIYKESEFSIKYIKIRVMYRFSEKQILFGFLAIGFYFLKFCFLLKTRFKNRLLNMKPILTNQNRL